MGRKGRAVTFCTLRDMGKLKRILHQNKVTPVWLGESAPLANAHKAARPSTGHGPKHAPVEDAAPKRRRRPRRNRGKKRDPSGGSV